MTVRTTTAAQVVTGNVIDGLTGPFFTSATPTGINQVDSWDFQADLPSAASPLGAINFQAGASTVFGLPLLVDPNLSGTMTNANAPFIFSDNIASWQNNTVFVPNTLVRLGNQIWRRLTAGTGGSPVTRTVITFTGTYSNAAFASAEFAGFGNNTPSAGTPTIINVRLGNNSDATNTSNIFNNALQVFARNNAGNNTIFASALASQINNTADIQMSAVAGSDGTNAILELAPSTGLSMGLIMDVSNNLSQYNAGSINNIVDTANWEFIAINTSDTWYPNPDSIVDLDSEGRIQEVETNVLRLSGTFNSDDGTGINYSMHQSDTPSCSPVYYGTNIIQEGNGTGNSFMNICAQNTGEFNVFTNSRAAPQFHNVKFSTSGTSNFRWGSKNYLINGFAYTTFGSGAFEFPVVPNFTPQGLQVFAPNFLNLVARAALVFCDQPDSSTNRSDLTYTFEAPTFANFPTYNGFNTANSSKNNGYVIVNPIGSPPQPYSTTATAPPTTGFLNKPMLLGSRDTGTGVNGFANKLNTNTQLMTQRVRINLPYTGGTVRVIKTATAGYFQDASAQRSIVWQGTTRDSNGSLTRVAASYDTTTEYFATNAANTENDGLGIRNILVMETSADRGSFQTADVPVFYAYDGVATTNQIDLLLPAYMNDAIPGSGENDTNMIYFSYKFIFQDDFFGTQVRYLSYDPANTGTDPTQVGYVSAAWNTTGNEVLNITDTADDAFVATASSYQAEIGNLQELYDALKTYQRLRLSETNYDASHRTSDVAFLTRSGTSFQTNIPNVSFTTAGNSITLPVSNDLGFKVSSSFVAGDLTRVNEFTCSSFLDLRCFPSFVGVTLNCNAIDNYAGRTIDGTINAAASSNNDTGTALITIASTGFLNMGSNSLVTKTPLTVAAGGRTIGRLNVGGGVLIYRGTHTGGEAILINGSSSADQVISGNITGAVSFNNASGTVNFETGAVLVGNLRLISASLIMGTGSDITGLVTAGTIGAGDHSIAGTITGDLVFGNTTANSEQTFITSTGSVSGNVTGGTGRNDIGGPIGGNLILGNNLAGNGNSAFVRNTVAGTLSLGSGDWAVSGAITGNATIAGGSGSTISVSDMSGTLTIPGATTLTTTLGRTISGAVNVGAGDHTFQSTFGSSVTTTTGNQTFAGSYAGRATATTGNHIFSGAFSAGIDVDNGDNTWSGTYTGNSFTEYSSGSGTNTFSGTLSGGCQWIIGNGLTTVTAAATFTGSLTKEGTSGSTTNILVFSSSFDASNLDLIVPTGTLEVFGLPRTALKSVTGSANFNVPDVTTTFRIPSSQPSGRAILKLRTAAAGTYLADVEHTFGTNTDLGTVVNESTSTDYDVYYKPTNTFGTTGIFYTTTVGQFQNTGSVNSIETVQAIPFVNSLTENAENADLTGLGGTIDTITTQTVGTLRISGATPTAITSQQTQALLLRAMDDANYLNLMANRTSTIDFLQPLANSGTSVNTVALTLNTGTTNVQQVVTAIEGSGNGTLVATFTVGGATFASVIIIPNPAGATVNDIEGAVRVVLDARLLTKNNVGNIGLNAPVFDTGTDMLVTTPVLTS